MGNVTWRISKRKTRQRRSANLKLKQSLNLSECPNCHQKKMPHRVCPNCGYYDGKDVMHSAE